MKGDKNVPGYLTLEEAESIYGTKADTLKRRCQNGKVIGAIKKGKTWFVPSLPNIDPQKPIHENYPTLDFDAAYRSIMALYDAESMSRQLLHDANRQYIYCWEYGYYFFSLIFSHSKPMRSTLPLAALISEAHTALRSSFLLNLYGYHPDAYALLRRAHESTMKAIAGKKEPGKIWKVSFAKNRQKVESMIGMNFKGIWAVESSFAHSNSIKLFETGISLQRPEKDMGIFYGPQRNEKQFRAVANTSIFWLYVLTRSLSYILTGQISSFWMTKQHDSAKFLKDHLLGVKGFQSELHSFEQAMSKLEGK